MEPWLIAALTALCLISIVTCQVLNPPYFNLAEGKKVVATSTCGVGVSEREWYCRLTGATYTSQSSANDEDFNANSGSAPGRIIQGQLCDYCDPRDKPHGHPSEQAVDGTEKWWQSPPLSRGMQYNEVNLTVDLGQEFHVAYVFIKMANSPRPGVWALERSTDYGQTWKPWQFFADSNSDCLNFFNTTLDTIEKDDSVMCATEFSKVVPLESGEIVVSLVNGRPNANNFSMATTLQDWTLATNVRLRLLRTKTLLGHLMQVARQDPTVTRRYFYSIKDISIGGRCVCNGHAEFCDKRDPYDPEKLLCRCQHNTCGAQCEKCCPGYIQKPWRPATEERLNECEACQCFGHSDQCVFDPEVARTGKSLDIHGNYEGGGVCQNCRHNTQGNNCDDCKFGYYRPEGVPLHHEQVCQACQCNNYFSTGDCEDGTGKCYCKEQYAGDNCQRCAPGYYGYPNCIPCSCNVNGTEGGVCEVGGGLCPCKRNYTGRNCDACAPEFHGFPDCQACRCDNYGSLTRNCDQSSGMCPCRSNFNGQTCSECRDGYYNYPNCDFCTCDLTGSVEEVCDKQNGRCICKENYGGAACDRCNRGYYNYPTCLKCECSPIGSQSEACADNGQCQCKANFAGRNCDRCGPGFYKYPECLPCGCDLYGARGTSCDQETGQCNCRNNFHRLQCNRCKDGFYNYPVCEECNCNPAGALQVPGSPLGGCGTHTNGQLCQCKERVTGHICDQCKATFWNLNINNPDACEDCGCDRAGTLGSTARCDQRTGQCPCKTHVTSRMCSQCLDGTFRLQAYNVFGCKDCGCDVGGAWDNICEKSTGQCRCRPRVSGFKCERPERTHFYPTLLQMRYEMEDGQTPSGGAVRFGFDDLIFEDFSWRGYAVYSRVQPSVVVDIDVTKSSVYRLLFRYVNRNLYTKQGEVKVVSLDPQEQSQFGSIVFQAMLTPSLATAVQGGVPSGFVLNEGRYRVTLTTEDGVLVDYLALLPEDYFRATVLKTRPADACLVPLTDEPCIHYVYIPVDTKMISRGEQGYFARDRQRVRTQLFANSDIVRDLETPAMALLDVSQPNMYIDLVGFEPNEYVLVINYYSTVKDRAQPADVDVASTTGRTSGKVEFLPCEYSSLCRVAVMNRTADDVAKFDIQTDYATMTITGQPDINVAIDSVLVIPVSQWDISYLRPNRFCLRVNKKCVGSAWISGAAIKVEVEDGDGEPDTVTRPPYITDINIKVVKLDKQKPTISVDGSVNRQGRYKYILHYYQDQNPTFSVNVVVSVDGKQYTGKFRADHCANSGGCRGLITFDNGAGPDTIDLTTTDFRITLNNTDGRPVWLDYFVVIPAADYTEQQLKELPRDNSGYFLTECAGEEYDVSESASEYCKSAVFSITTDYNNGALECDCNVDGSLSLDCGPYGGECRCKDNVIGRKCSQCRTGYYAFPECKVCNCPTGLCDSITGQCNCPPRVTGADCNVCLPNTFGYDPFIGCEDCNCDPQGVEDNQVGCDINTGQCKCRENIGRRTCSACQPGFYNFPQCLPCRCDRSGTNKDVCDQRTAQCFCKENVEGVYCDSCKAGSYYLEDRNIHGCTKCFCFGTTDQCTSSTLRKAEVTELNGWKVTNMESPSLVLRNNELTMDGRGGPVDPLQAIYWVAPSPYLGDKVTSYGGNLEYMISFTIPTGDRSSGMVRSDVILQGNGMTIGYLGNEQPAPGRPLKIQLHLVEREFNHNSTGEYVKREQFMSILSNLEALHIRASYYTEVETVKLSEVRLEYASPLGRGGVAKNVEQCQCPPSYTGTSCEDCIAGYYKKRRSTTGPPVCTACQCNGRADTCDQNTGICIECRDDTEGDHCEKCKSGYYRDPITGGCKICACPKPYPTNNFATTCEVINGDVILKCSCLPGYSGPKCESCETGFYGDPSTDLGKCSPCQCSGNIDPNDPGGCDPLSGTCLRCQYNTTGTACEQCAEWHYGDGLVRSCAPCECERCGTERCDNGNGVCLCKTNVVGPECNRCAPHTYGFTSCRGCEACACGPASVSASCEEASGQCQCRPGVTGRQCERCKDGYWNYNAYGCTECRCDGPGATTCDANTGQCMCKRGYVGTSCDKCDLGWIEVPGEGCQECDSCVFLLLNDVERMTSNLTDVISGLDDVSVGVFAYRRLQGINDTVSDLRPDVDTLNPDSVDLTPLQNELESVEDFARRVASLSGFVKQQSEEARNDAAKDKDISMDLLDQAKMAVDASNDAVMFVEKILKNILDGIQVTNIGDLLQEAEEILREIQSRDFANNKEATNIELDEAVDLLDRVRSLRDATRDHVNHTQNVMERVTGLHEKLQDLIDRSKVSIRVSDDTLYKDKQNLIVYERLKNLIDQVNNMKSNITMLLNMAATMIEQSEVFINTSISNYLEVKNESDNLDDLMKRLRDFKVNRTGENTGLRPLVNSATEHAKNLEQEAEFLRSLIRDTQQFAEHAVRAARAYEDIVEAIDQAANSSTEAIRSASVAIEMSEGLDDDADQSRERSQGLLDKARKSRDDVASLRQRMDDSLAAINDLITKNTRLMDGLQLIQNGLGMLPVGGYSEQARQAAELSQNALDRATETNERIQVIENGIPNARMRLFALAGAVRAANTSMNHAEYHVNSIRKQIPEAIDKITRLQERARKFDLLMNELIYNVTALREKIYVTRGVANRIHVGVTYDRSVTVQARNPPNLEHAGSFTKFSLFVNTSEKNAFLTYIGPNIAAGGASKDYMALELINGNVVLKYDLGSGLAQVRNPAIVNDKKWHEIIVERMGRVAKVTVRTENEADEVAEGIAPGTAAVLELDQENSVFFIGGVPKQFRLPVEIAESRFAGCIENVVFDEFPVGLWNFAYGDNNVNGCRERDVLQRVAEDGYYFTGNGYLVLNKGSYRVHGNSDFMMKFKTFAENGLLLFIGQGNDFLSIELKGGKVLYQYDLGGGRAQIMSDKAYNDGKWHDVMASRKFQDGVLRVDGEMVASGSSKGDMQQLSTTSSVYIGGFTGTNIYDLGGITTMGFEGCIKVVQMGTKSVNLNNNEGAKGIVPGCPSKVARVVSFLRDGTGGGVGSGTGGGGAGGGAGGSSFVSTGYTVNINTKFDSTMKIKTLESDALILYTASVDQRQALSIAVVGGRLVVTVTTDGVQTTSRSSSDTFNDGRWHYISLHKDGDRLMIGIDDKETLSMSLPSPRLNTNSRIFFGGVPEGYIIANENSATVVHMIGCVGDVMINDQFLNFALLAPSDRMGASLAGCPIRDPSAPTPIPGIIPPFTPPSATASPNECRLQQVAANYEVGGPGDGTSFGYSKRSRQEYDNLPSTYRQRHEISLEFKTSSSDGLIFYVADERHADYIYLTMRQGELIYSFNSGSGAANITSTKMFNDGNWHRAVIWRESDTGRLTVDDQAVYTGKSGGDTRSISTLAPHFVGALSAEAAEKARNNLNVYADIPFTGCLRKFQINSRPFGTPSREFDVKPCYVNYEVGAYFGVGGGFIRLEPNFKVGLDLDIHLEIRPRSLDGVLISVTSSAGDYMILQLVQGELLFSVNNGAGDVTTTYTPLKKAALCDGNWHYIQAVKAKNVVTLNVDGTEPKPGFGVAGVSSTDTDDPLYIGGVADVSTTGGIRTSRQYVGCIRDVRFQYIQRDLVSGMANGDVNKENCPVNIAPIGS